MSEPLVVAEELEKEYRTGPEVVRVLRGASLVVRPAEIVALVGASGVGKSTLLHLLGALDRPTAGRVLFRGDRKGTRLNSSHSQISYAVFCLKKKTTRTHTS